MRCSNYKIMIIICKIDMSNTNNNQTIDCVNQITLDCLLNREMYGKLLNKTHSKKENLKDMKFYRKRIFDLAKRLLTSKEERNNINPDVIYAFNNFVKTSINYFKIIDKQDILQKDYEELNVSLSNECEDIVNDNTDYNQFIMKSITMPQEKTKITTLENFVIRKETNEEKETMIYPQKREYNLKDESLKEKGITKKDAISKKEVKKKKNIHNKYDTENNKLQEKTNKEEKNNKE